MCPHAIQHPAGGPLVVASAAAVGYPAGTRRSDGPPTTPRDPVRPMPTRLTVRLSAFMFLQYFIWGSWYSSMGIYLENTLRFGGQEIGAAYGAFAIGSMISPFFVGLVADRYFASEKLLGALGLFGGGVICRLPSMQECA